MDVKSIYGSECPLECESVSYNLYTSQAEYPSKNYAKLLMRNPWIRTKYASKNLSELTEESLKRNMVEITVYYSNLGYENYEEMENMSGLDLASNVGGTLGLFLGMSFLSLIEFVDVFLQICFYKRKETQ